MIYLIVQLAPWLLLTTMFAALAAWMFAAERAAPGEAAAERERENLLRDLVRFTGDGPVDREIDLDAAPTQRLLEIRDGRIAELERALETARSRSDDLTSELAVFQRGGKLNDLDAEELARLRAAEIERERTVDAEVEPVEDENVALQAWRLRYFEQRVQYLEGQTRVAPPQAVAAPIEEIEAPPPVLEWTAREASARAAFLEDELRAARASAEAPVAEAPVETAPFAADADVDMLLRWRLLYLERRVAHLQAKAPAAEVEAPPVMTADPDRWKWRARYLEARVRHLEERPVQYVAAPVETPQRVAADAVETPQRVVQPTPSRRAKPPVLPAARNGAPDDLTLIEGVSLLQQTTLYSLGVFHFDQIAAWSEENVAWVDQYLRLQGRISDQEWLEQAADLAREGPAAARRVLQDEDV